MGACNQTNIPTLNQITDPCFGEHTSTECIIHTPAIISLGLPQPNNSLLNIITNIASALRPKYRVYTALLSQVGDGTSTQNSGVLTIGRRYAIITFEEGDDFTDVANVVSGTINTTECQFIATGTTPTSWSNGSTLRDTSAPVATVLENTIGNIVWTYVSIGIYRGRLVGAFTANKSFSILGSVIEGGDYERMGHFTYRFDGVNDFYIYTIAITNDAGLNECLLKTPIEIRVYPT